MSIGRQMGGHKEARDTPFMAVGSKPQRQYFRIYRFRFRIQISRSRPITLGSGVHKDTPTNALANYRRSAVVSPPRLKESPLTCWYGVQTCWTYDKSLKSIILTRQSPEAAVKVATPWLAW